MNFYYGYSKMEKMKIKDYKNNTDCILLLKKEKKYSGDDYYF